MEHDRVGQAMAVRIEVHCAPGMVPIPPRYFRGLGDLVERCGWANVERASIAQLKLADRMPSAHPDLGVAGAATPAAVAMVLERLPNYVRSMLTIGRRSE